CHKVLHPNLLSSTLIFLLLTLISQLNPQPQHVPQTETQTEPISQIQTETQNQLVPLMDALEPIIRPSTRPKRAPAHIKDYHCLITTSSHSTSPYLLASYLSYQFPSPSQKAYTISISPLTEPTSYAQASKEQCWIEAMQAELNALESNYTWDIVDRPPGTKPIGSKWVYKIKRKIDGNVERFKAHLVAKDKHSATFTCFSLHKNWSIHQLEVNNSFLHGDLHGDVYMEIPQGVTIATPHKVCKLVKSLCGLKQASKKWFEKLPSLLLQLGFQQAMSDYSVFIKSSPTSFLGLLIYVDDIVLVGDCLSDLQFIKAILHQHFGIKDLGILKFFLGLEIAHPSRCISICQKQYCLDLLTDTGALDH
ncbi:hypothetical protein CR513_36222, partial [Mucuna pruriens]